MTTIVDFARHVATEAHGSQKRRDGSLYINHPRRVANLMQIHRGDSHEINALLASCWLHDVLEDTSLTYYDIVQNFGYQIASLVLEVTSNPEMKHGVGNKAEYLSYKLKHMTSWALTIKLCDRLDNLSDNIEECNETWLTKYLFETIHILNYLQTERSITGANCVLMQLIFARCRDIAAYLQVQLEGGNPCKTTS